LIGSSSFNFNCVIHLRNLVEFIKKIKKIKIILFKNIFIKLNKTFLANT